MSKPRIALIAHDAKKDEIVALAGEFRATLAQCRLVATGTTGGRIADAHGLDYRPLGELLPAAAG